MRSLKRRVVILFFIILVGGIVLTVYSVHLKDSAFRDELLADMRLIKAGINPVAVTTLTGSDADLSSPVYQALKEQMADIRAADPLIRSAYLIGRHPDGTYFLFVDSEPINSQEYSPPGQVYREVAPFIKSAFTSQQAVVSGPVMDSQGSWIRGLVPVPSHGDGTTIALLGVDIDAGAWKTMLALAAVPPVSGTVIALIILFFWYRDQVRGLQERRRLEVSEREIRESETKYRTVFENTGTASVIIEEDTTISLVNSQFEHLSGYSRDEIEGKMSWTTFVDPVDLERMRDQHRLRRQDREKASRQYEFHFLDRNGTPHYILLTIDMIPGTGESIASLLDITHRRQMEEAVVQANRKLNLLGSITRHDIQNQILILQGFLEIARENIASQEKMKVSLDKAVETVENIEHQISFTRDYQELGIGPPIWQDLELTVTHAKDALSMGNIHLYITCPGIEVYADALFEKVIYNLLDNSLRYGGQGHTKIEISTEENADGLVIIIADDGAGVTEDMKVHLFERGFGKNKGLGLFLCREILSITSLSIRETGTPGKGARFEIFVPKENYRFKPGKLE